jgi:hypothetical protein
MKFLVWRTSIDDNKYEVEINTLEELMTLVKDEKEEIIIGLESYGFDSKKYDGYIEIYDDWRE